MNKPKRRYTEVGEIDRYSFELKRKASDLMKSAEALEIISKEQAKNAESMNSDQDRWILQDLSDENKKKSCQLRKTATTIMEVKLVELKNKRSELQTIPLMGILEDASVEA
jgi:hypothetical protein